MDTNEKKIITLNEDETVQEIQTQTPANQEERYGGDNKYLLMEREVTPLLSAISMIQLPPSDEEDEAENNHNPTKKEDYDIIDDLKTIHVPVKDQPMEETYIFKCTPNNN